MISPKVAIIGGGWSGLAAAVDLADRGIPSTVFEAAPAVGGRARVLERDGRRLDNGQHILIGAYAECLGLMRRVGVAPEQALLRLPLTLEYPGELSLTAPRLPAPLNLAWALARARGLTWGDRLAALRLVRCVGSGTPAGSVAQLLDRTGQSATLRRLVWEPLCIATLNTPVAQACARVFAAVLRDGLLASRAASDLLLPRVDLSALFPQAAARFLEARGGRVITGRPIERIEQDADGFRLHPGEPIRYAHLVLAVAPHQLERLVASFSQLDPIRSDVARLGHEPIITCYLDCGPTARLPRPMLGMSGGLSQWLFDRGQLGGPAGLIASVVSAAAAHRGMTREAIAASVAAEVGARFPHLPAPRWSLVITEKRATFSCRPDAPRPASRTPLPGVHLAGDYVESAYPATLESAVRSGLRCAAQIAADLRATA
jgi:squalene-associated FAD-dependent desaturase